MSKLQRLCDQLWSGEISVTSRDHHPFAALDLLEEIGSGVAFYKHFVNVVALRTDIGLVMVDTGPFQPALRTHFHRRIRSWSADPLHAAIYTHGHADHACGLPPYLAECEEKNLPSPRIIGHTAVAPRMERYLATKGYNDAINSRQFGLCVDWPTDWLPPTEVYDGELELELGGVELRLFHARGETDDHTVVYLPKQRVLCTGDLFIWAAPNAGNPQKVQRYAWEWAAALRRMEALGAEVLLPGHGVPIVGEGRVRQALADTAAYLESLCRQTLDLMNQGAPLEAIVHTVKPPAELTQKPYLQPVYDEPEFIVRNIWRLLGGWYDGTPSHLKPAPLAEQGAELVQLAGGVERVLERAAALKDAGRWSMACHLLDWAAAAAPDSLEVHRLRARVYQERGAATASTMARGIFLDAARASRRVAEDD